MYRRFLSLANDLFSRAGAVFGVWQLFIITIGVVAGFVSISGMDGSYRLLGIFLAIFTVIVIFVFSSYFLRLSLISWALRKDLAWFRICDPTVLVGVGPGGAILAGLVAKHMAKEFDIEPHVLVANRIFTKIGPRTELRTAVPEDFLEGLSDKSLEELSEREPKVIVISSEVHSGSTISNISQSLSDNRIQHTTFALIVSPNSNFDVDHFLVSSDNRGLLPWPDAPSRKQIKL